MRGAVRVIAGANTGGEALARGLATPFKTTTKTY